jgi:glycerol-3-phosphate acyltransferase PlsY
MEFSLFSVIGSAIIGLFFGLLPVIASRFGLRLSSAPAVTLLSDVARGAAACGAAYLVGGSGFGMAIAGTFALFAHNFNPFVRPRGTGAAVALGIALAINPLPAALWCVMWLTGYGVIRRERVVGNIAGILGTMLLIATTPNDLLQLTMIAPGLGGTQITMLTFIVCSQMFIRIIPAAREFFRREREIPYSDRPDKP